MKKEMRILSLLAFIVLSSFSIAAEAVGEESKGEEKTSFMVKLEPMLSEEGESPELEKFSIVLLKGTKVGEIWVTRKSEKRLEIEFLSIDENHRRKGYASSAMLRLFEVYHKEGVKSYTLSVFVRGVSKKAALGLYKKLGFKVKKYILSRTYLRMKKTS